MKRLFAGGTCMAVAMSFGMVVFAQNPQTPPQPQSPASESAQATSAEQQVTLVGCVQREDEYRRANNLGRGGAVGTGVGVGNEFVLTNASTSTGATAGAAPTGEPAGAATGTAGTMGQAYELTGSNEGQAGQFVGRRVEIVGKLKKAETSATGTTGGATAGAPPRGVDVTSPDLKLREVDVTSVRETTGTCPATPPR